MPFRSLAFFAALVCLPLACFTQVKWDDSLLKPFEINHRAATTSPADLSAILHDSPAGKDGYIRIQGGHFVKPNGQRIRFWGVHLTDWSPGSIELPPKEDTPMWARSLARYGVNIVRLHFIDKWAPTGITDGSKDDTRSFDPQQLDRLDFLVSELKKNGIYMDLNLNVGRYYKEGDGVVDAAQVNRNWVKSLSLFDKRIIELEKEWSKNLLTHVNPYTKTEYRNEPAIALVEILNENGIGQGYNPPTKFYADELDGLYNDWLKAHLSAAELQKMREMAGVQGDAPVPRMRGNDRATAPKERYETEVRFFMDLENGFYQDMRKYLRELGVKQPMIGTADHGHSGPPWAMLASLSNLDILDGHIYWNQYIGVGDVPMVNDPARSTVVQLSRTAFAGKPYTVSETNHPFPNEYASEGIPILAAYALFQDWDMVIQYTFEPKKDPAWKPYVGDPFDISHDPVRMTEMAAGALMFLRGDVKPARQTIERTYSREQVLDAGLLPGGLRAGSEQPYFTPGFPLTLPLEHEVRIKSFNGPPTAKLTASGADPIVSDTGELRWYTTPSPAAPPAEPPAAGGRGGPTLPPPNAKDGLVTVETDRTQALIGFIKANRKSLKNLSADVSNDFATIILTSMENKPLARAGKILLTACSRMQNTDEKWNDAHTGLGRGGQGHSPTLIEPVAGTVTLRGIEGAKSVSASALDGSGKPIGEAIEFRKTAQGWALPIGSPVTTWYVIRVAR
ncbi:MAG TPA: hypothetical protein VN736_05100 [Candidatus Limnocylindrales bacterium]|nr:hypothetical protein [Candidatus Limnocylindrales bacterium]